MSFCQKSTLIFCSSCLVYSPPSSVYCGLPCPWLYSDICFPKTTGLATYKSSRACVVIFSWILWVRIFRFKVIIKSNLNIVSGLLCTILCTKFLILCLWASPWDNAFRINASTSFLQALLMSGSEFLGTVRPIRTSSMVCRGNFLQTCTSVSTLHQGSSTGRRVFGILLRVRPFINFLSQG